MGTIINSCNIPLSEQNTSVPDVSGALQSYFQQMVFTLIKKTVVNFQAVETPTRINFWGTIQPASANQLRLLPEGQRTQWQWFTVHAEPGLVLVPDEIFYYLGKQYRLMERRDFTLYGYVEYLIQTDWSVPPS